MLEDLEWLPRDKEEGAPGEQEKVTWAALRAQWRLGVMHL